MMIISATDYSFNWQGLTPVENIEEAHMRNRQTNSLWAYEKGKQENVIEKKIKNRQNVFCY